VLLKPVFACLLAAALILGIAAAPALAGTRTDIPSASVETPREFWRAVMEHFYGGYDRARKCWVGEIDGDRHCMRPHRLDTVSAGGAARHFVVTGGYRIDGDDGPATCHACSGSLGLIVLEDAGGRLELVARNSLVALAGSWGRIPPEESFRLREIGGDRHGWTMETGWAGQGYVYGSVVVYGVSGSDVIQLGHIPVHADNSGYCGEGLPKCFVHDYELVFDPGPDGSFHDIVLRKTGGEAEDPDGFRVPFDDNALKYQVPAEVDRMFQY
jgi:hypothetical protein